MRQIDRKDLLAQLLPVVRTAGDAIMAIYRRGSAEVSRKADASPVTEADLASHRVLATHLALLLHGCHGQPLLYGKPDVLNPSFIATSDTALIPA